MIKNKIHILIFFSFYIFIIQPILGQQLFLGEFNEKLSKSGLQLGFDYTGEIFSVVSGGIERESVYLDNFDLTLNLDMNTIFGWEGAQIFTYILGNHGGAPSQHSGAIQGISNIEAHDTWKLYEFWIEQNLFGNKLSILFGLFDLNSEFDMRESSTLFLNPSHGIGHEYSLTGHNGPSIFPTTSIALRAEYYFSNTISLKLAAFDGVPGNLSNPNGTQIVLDKDEGFLISTELSVLSNSGDNNEEYFNYAIGAWYYTQKFEKLNLLSTNSSNLSKKNNYGIYISGEQFVLSENRYDDQGLALFLRAGISENSVNQIDGYFGFGATYKGLIPERKNDQFGIAIAASHNSKLYRQLLLEENINQNVSDFEYIFEITYNFELFDYLQIQPDIQYVINPASTQLNKHAFVFGTRISLSF